jgi:energy-coupling factor transporter ATP-binding protein EcfA2
MDEFYTMVSSALPCVREGNGARAPCVANVPAKFTKHQIIVIVGETGSGKTTQYGHLSLDP